MRKAHLYEAAYKFNQGMDDAVCAVQRLKKAPQLTLDTYEEGDAELELRRSKINVQFMSDLLDEEKDNLKILQDEYDELIDEPLDHTKICQLMRIVEQQRHEEGQPALVVFTEAAPPLPPESPSDNPNLAAATQT